MTGKPSQPVKLRKGSKLDIRCESAVVTARYTVDTGKKFIPCIRVRVHPGFRVLHFTEDRFNELFSGLQ